MNLKSYFFDDDRGVSPVIGVILMVAITVILAAVIATFVMNMGPPKDQAPTASWSVSSSNVGSSGSDSITFTHNGGKEVDGGELYVKISGASASDSKPGDDSNSNPSGVVNAEHSWSSIGGTDPVSASDSASVDQSDFGNKVTSIDLDGATVELVWKSSSTDKSDVLKTWSS